MPPEAVGHGDRRTLIGGAGLDDKCPNEQGMHRPSRYGSSRRQAYSCFACFRQHPAIVLSAQGLTQMARKCFCSCGSVISRPEPAISPSYFSGDYQHWLRLIGLVIEGQCDVSDLKTLGWLVHHQPLATLSIMIAHFFKHDLQHNNCRLHQT